MALVLCDAPRIIIARRQIALQVVLDVVPHTKRLAKIDYTQSVVSPICGFGHRQIVHSPDFVQVHETVGLANDLE